MYEADRCQKQLLAIEPYEGLRGINVGVQGGKRTSDGAGAAVGAVAPAAAQAIAASKKVCLLLGLDSACCSRIRITLLVAIQSNERIRDGLPICSCRSRAEVSVCT